MAQLTRAACTAMASAGRQQAARGLPPTVDLSQGKATVISIARPPPLRWPCRPGPYPQHSSSASSPPRRLRDISPSASGYDVTASIDWDGTEPRVVELPKLPPSARKYASLLPPFWERQTAVYEFFDGLWFFEQPLDLGAGNISMRMTVFRLSDGTLWVHSPVALTEECRRALAALGGEVSHIVVPSLAPQHWLYAAVYARHFPSAKVWVPPGLLEMGDRLGLENLGVVELSQLCATQPEVMGYSAPEAWQQDIQASLFACSLYVEAAFCLKRHGVLLTSDLCFGSLAKSPSRPPPLPGALGDLWATVARIPLQATSMLGRLGSPLAYPIFNAHKEAALLWVIQIVDMDFDIVIPAHFDAPIYNGKRRFFECFDYVLSWDERAKSDSVDII